MARLALLTILVVTPLLSSGADKPVEKKPEKPPTPAAEYQRLANDFEAKKAEGYKAYTQAKTDQEKSKIKDQVGETAKTCAERMIELAKANPKDPVAIDALAWVADNGFVDQLTKEKAVDLLFTGYFANERLGQICPVLARSKSPQAESRLRLLMEKSPHKKVQALACMNLATYFKKRYDASAKDKAADADKLRHEAEVLLERVLAQYADLENDGQKLGDLAHGDLFELRNLGLGMVVPEIEGEDVDGKKFKLSDYRGKVVLLDFWGNW
jgi:hypothetical protein